MQSRNTITMVLPILLLPSAAVSGDVQVTINPAVEHQTILGWGVCILDDIDIPPWLLNQILDTTVNDLGHTRLRLELPRGNKDDHRGWEWFNDNGDPDDIHWPAYSSAQLDHIITKWVLPFRQRVQANGAPFDIWVSPSFFDGGSTGSAPAWLLNSPAEYAEFAISVATFLRDNYGITPNHHIILNEAGNGNPFSSDVVGRMIRTLGPAFQSSGFSTRIQFPECVSADSSWSYIQDLQDDPDIWPYIGLLSYHGYGGQGSRAAIRNFGIARGIPTAETEYMGGTIDRIYEDMIEGGVSYWEQLGLAFYGNDPSAGDFFTVNKNLTSFDRCPRYWDFRQIMHYVRPSAVRVDAISDDTQLPALAYVCNGQMSVILINKEGSGAKSVDLSGLPAGTYGVCQSIRHQVYQELGLQSVGGAGTLSISMPDNTVLTVYPYPGTNQPPTVTDWKATPNYLILPGSSTTLSASSTDSELDAISYLWTVSSKPAGASPNLATPNEASTSVTGLTATGEYVFTVRASDLAHQVERDVHLNVFADNQPPKIGQVHNRQPVRMFLPTSSTSLRAERIDQEDDALSYLWSIVSQPPGANAMLATPTATPCQAYNMTIAGDYTFKFELSDPTHTVSKTLTVPVYPANGPPVIADISATPSQVRIPASSTSLSAATSDPNGDAITHFWSIASAPAGTQPVFTNQGSANTNVTGLTGVGVYVFTLSVIDEIAVTTRDVTVRVTRQPGDFDYDLDVDQEDFGRFQACYSGAGMAYDPGCEAADLSYDGDVDLDDFAIFAGCVGGEGQPPGC